MKKTAVAETVFITANISMPACNGKIVFPFHYLKAEWDESSEIQKEEIVLHVAALSGWVKVDYATE